MLVIEKLDKLVGRISVGFLGPDRAGSRGYNDEVCNVVKIKTCFRVSHPRASNDLTEYGSLAMDQQGQVQGVDYQDVPFRPYSVCLGGPKHCNAPRESVRKSLKLYQSRCNAVSELVKVHVA
jgi:hypothetical protein